MGVLSTSSPYAGGGRETLRELLNRLQKEAYQRIEELRIDQRQEFEFGPADAMDSARATEEVETHAGLIARAEEKLRYLDEAIARLDAGKYGRCLRCREPIPTERLLAIPFAAYCVNCQEQLHRARGGWGEGNTIAPYDQQWTLPEEMREPVELESRTTDPEEQLDIQERANPKNRRAEILPRKRIQGRGKGPKR